jgi:hypothetical protein
MIQALAVERGLNLHQALIQRLDVYLTGILGGQ